MKLHLLVLSAIGLLVSSCVSTTTFPNFSHYDTNLPSIASFPCEKAPAVIHRASRGITIDDAYRQRAYQARRQPEIRWGAYHFCTGASIDRQLKLAMSRVGYDPNGTRRTLMVFDFEHNSHNSRDYMKVAELAELIRRFHSTTKVYPVLYANPGWFNKRLKTDSYSRGDLAVIRKCPLWTSAYRAKPAQIEGLGQWTIWQYAGDSSLPSYGDYVSGPERMKYPRGIPGVGSKLEMNIYNGSPASLQAFVAQHSIPTRL